MSNKKKDEEKYCQENFKSQADADKEAATLGLGIGAALGGILLLALLIWWGYKYYKNINKITQEAKRRVSGDCIEQGMKAAQVFNLPDATKYKPCTCYFDTIYEHIGCTNSTKIMDHNPSYVKPRLSQMLKFI
jgi:hypothetical protein